MVFTNWNLNDKVLYEQREFKAATESANKIKVEKIQSAEREYLDKIAACNVSHIKTFTNLAKELYLSYFQQGSFKVLYSRILEMIKDEAIDRYYINCAFDELKTLIYYDIKENPNYPKEIKDLCSNFYFSIKMKPNGEVYFKDN